jgi:RNA-directed DNA polymerase
MRAGLSISKRRKNLSALTVRQAASEIASAFQFATPDIWAMSKAASRVIDAESELFVRLARDAVVQFGARLAVVSREDVTDYLCSHPALHTAFVVYDSGDEDEGEGEDDEAGKDEQSAIIPQRIPVRKSFIASPAKQNPPYWPIPAHNLPRVDCVADLSELLQVHPQRLDAWIRRFRPTYPVSQQKQSFDAYFSYWQAKPSGGARLIEHPKPDLKQAQRLLLRKLLNKVDPHEAAHGFRRGHSIVSHAEAHAGSELVLRCDLKDFFPGVRASRVHAIFRYLGYHETVARALTRVTTTRATSRTVHEGKQHGVDFSTLKRYQSDHLPQGAPTSPALANLAAFKLDLRLNALAEQWNVSYSRYADDLAFSGAINSGMKNERFYLRIAAIALEEGFALNMRKTRWMHASQRQEVTGLVINAKPNIAREEYDRLKAILTNAVRHGLVSQNRAMHADFYAQLQGRIAFVLQINPHRGAKLAALLAKAKP